MDQGLLRKLPDDWKERYPNLASVTSHCPAQEYYDNMLGGTYVLFRSVFANNYPGEYLTSHLSLYVRKDLAEEAGYDLSGNLESMTMTMSELDGYLRAVKDAGLVEYPFWTTPGTLSYVYSCVSEGDGAGSSCYIKDQDGNYVWGPGQDDSKVKDTTRYMYDWYQDNLIYPDFYTLPTDADREEMLEANDCAAIMQAGMVGAAYDFNRRYNESHEGRDYRDDVAVFVLTDDDGVAHGTPSYNFWGTHIFSPDVSDEKMDRILSVMDYAASEEGNLISHLGLPGVDWEYDENGKPVSLLEDGVTLEDKYTTITTLYESLVACSDDFSFINPIYPDWCKEVASDLYRTRDKVTNVKDKEIDWSLAGYTSPALSQATLIYSDEYINLMMASGDFDAAYDSWVEDKMTLIQPVLDELNSLVAQ